MAESESVHSVVKRAREDQIAAQKRREERSWLAGYDAGVRQAAATLEEAAKTAHPYAAAALLAHVRIILSMTPEEPSDG